MEPQSRMPIITKSSEIQEMIEQGFNGVANVCLNKDTIEFLLSLNKNNRRIKKESVNAYIHSFQTTGYACINLMHVSKFGELADGQHRLLALRSLCNSGFIKESWQLVKFGTTEITKLDIDNGVSRSFKDTLKLNGFVTDRILTSSLRQYAVLMSSTNRTKFTANELKDIYEDDFKQVLELGDFNCIHNLQLLGGRSYRPAPWVVSIFRICQKCYGNEKMKAVYDEFYNGEDASLPMVRFRNWLVNNRNMFHFSPQMNSAKQIAGYLFYAVKKSIAGERIQRLVSIELGTTINGKRF